MIWRLLMQQSVQDAVFLDNFRKNLKWKRYTKPTEPNKRAVVREEVETKEL